MEIILDDTPSSSMICVDTQYPVRSKTKSEHRETMICKIVDAYRNGQTTKSLAEENFICVKTVLNYITRYCNTHPEYIGNQGQRLESHQLRQFLRQQHKLNKAKLTRYYNNKSRSVNIRNPNVV